MQMLVGWAKLNAGKRGVAITKTATANYCVAGST
tara:strand:- start:109 stop:210 length:102 start_codon:yes stop_codon:yes gene_type:complete